MTLRPGEALAKHSPRQKDKERAAEAAHLPQGTKPWREARQNGKGVWYYYRAGRSAKVLAESCARMFDRGFFLPLFHNQLVTRAHNTPASR